MDREAWDRRYAEAERVWSAGPNQFVEAEAAELPPGRALDLAAGEGRNALWLAERGWQVLAVDFSRVALDRGRREAEARGLTLDFVQADLTRWKPAPAAHDLVLLVYLHLPWPAMVPVVRGAAEAVAPGGTLLVVAHDLDNLRNGHGGPQDPDVLYTPDQVVAELAGLEIGRAETVERRVQTPEGEQIALDALVRASRPR
ncbi:MAG: methyltransferase domain-containing protein [Myxococcales bacterium]|jgi:SAM-dependent methyltransferase